MSKITLYHHPLSVCSMKARLALEEKGVNWTSHVIDIVDEQEQLDPWYVKLNTAGVVPTLEYSDEDSGSRIVTNSAFIIRDVAALDDGKQMLPPDSEAIRMQENLIDQADQIDLQILSYARHPSMEKSEQILIRRIEKAWAMAEVYPELRDSYEVCAKRSERNREFRVDPGHVKKIETDAQAALKVVEARLKHGEFLVGDNYTLADVIWTVVLSRFELLGYSSWVSGETYSRAAEYYSAMKTRPSFKTAQVQNQWWAK